MLYVSVILPVPVDGVFSYELPQEFEDRTQTGSRVVVPFGVNKLYTGIVVSLSDKAPEGDFKLKQVSDVLDPTPVVGRHIVHSYLVGSLMHTKVSSHTVASAVTKVITLLPHGIACCEVKLSSTCTTGKLQPTESNMALEHKGVHFFLFRRRLSAK